MKPAAPPTRAWLTATWMDGHGRRAKRTNGVLVVSVCVHPLVGPDRAISLITDVSAVVRTLARGRPSLSVLPAGLFSFDSDVESVRTGLSDGAVVVVGRDHAAADRQEALVLTRNEATIVVRGKTPVAGRRMVVGELTFAVFICGEVAGSTSRNLGPFHVAVEDGYGPEYLTAPASQLDGIALVVDIAHAYVPGTVGASEPSPRMAHQAALERLGQSGRAAVLAHRHSGETVNGRERADASSKWILFADGEWIVAREDEPLKLVEGLRLASDLDPLEMNEAAL